jgi:hypothetical protein
MPVATMQEKTMVYVITPQLPTCFTWMMPLHESHHSARSGAERASVCCVGYMRQGEVKNG